MQKQLSSQRTGMAISTIRRAIAKLSSQELPDDGRIRCAGAGRKPVEETYPDVVNLVQGILDDETYVFPESGRWTSCSLRNITKTLSNKGIPIEKSIADCEGTWLQPSEEPQNGTGGRAGF